MKHCCVVVADGARCRLFTVEAPSDSRFEGGPRLVEQSDLVNPEGELEGKELFSNLKSGRRRAPGRGPAHGLDDHRGNHQEEIERRFARHIAEVLVPFARDERADRIIVVAEPRLLGMLRDELDAKKLGVTLDELSVDLSWHAVSHIQDVLTNRGLLSPRRAPRLAYRPPGQPPPT